MTMNKADRDALRVQHEAATPGEWHVDTAPWMGLRYGVMRGADCIALMSNESAPDSDWHDATLIAVERNAIPELLDAADRAERYELALRAIVDDVGDGCYCDGLRRCEHEIAREALAQTASEEMTA